jgi:hypothetical protein
MYIKLLIGFMLLPLTGQAVEVYKCTDAQGRIGFSQHPCPVASQMQIQDIKPIDTIAPQAPDPQDQKYLQTSRQRQTKEQAQRHKQQAGLRKPKATAKEQPEKKEKASKPPKKPKAIKYRPIKLKSHQQSFRPKDATRL